MPPDTDHAARLSSGSAPVLPTAAVRWYLQFQEAPLPGLGKRFLALLFLDAVNELLAAFERVEAAVYRGRCATAAACGRDCRRWCRFARGAAARRGMLVRGGPLGGGEDQPRRRRRRWRDLWDRGLASQDPGHGAALASQPLA